MPTTRDPSNLYSIVDWTEEVNEVPNQYGWVKSQGIFNMSPTIQTSVLFDRNEKDITLLPAQNRGSRHDTVGKDRSVSTFAIPLSFFKHSEFITPEDIQSHRMPGTPDSPETLANVRQNKFEDGRVAVDQTQEYMMIQALKGITTTPDGGELVNMFTLFGISQPTMNFALGTATTEVYNKVSELKRNVQKNIRTGSVIQGIDVICSESFFDQLVTHPNVKEAYLNWSSNSRYRDEFSDYFSWGISDVFVYNGVRFITYPATFNLPGGGTEDAIDDGFAQVVPRARGLFRGYYGPNDKLTGANQPGREIFAFEYRDTRDENHEIEFETAPLMFATKPQVLYKLSAS